MESGPATRLRPFCWDDLEPLVALMACCEEEDRTGEAIQPEIVRLGFTTPGRDPEKTVQLLEDESGELIASCSAWPTPGLEIDTIQIGARIHPAYRSADLYTSLLGLAEERARTLHVPSGRPTELQSNVKSRPAMWRDAVDAAGYAPVRWFIDMRRALRDELPEPRIPDGFTIRFLDSGIEPLDLKHALDEAFLDHWNPQEITDEQFLHWTSSTVFRADLSAVALDASGRVVGGTIGVVRDVDARAGEREARVEVLGVRKAFRGRGLGRALLATCFAKMSAGGMVLVSLDVDADNPTGATGLYRSVGFEERDRVTVCAKPFAA